MHDFDVGRIFWKEWRAQRSFWLGIFGLAIGLELLLLCSSSFWQRLNPIDHLRFHQGLVMVLACSFATASAAIAFAGEVEAKTKGLLQRIPVRSRDLLAGKLSLSLIGSYALWVALWFIGGLMVLRATQTDLPPAVSADLARESSSFWAFLLAPPLFVVVGALFSLIMSDVLLTVLIAGLSSAALSAVPFVRDVLWLQVAIIVVVAGCDLFLVRRWLQSVGGAKWLALPQVTLPQFGIRRSATAIEPSIARESVRSPVAWRRAAGSLMWKEFRQACPFCLKLLVIGLIALFFAPLSRQNLISSGDIIYQILMILFLFAPLLPGVAAIRAERRDGAFRLLADHGVAPDGIVICKHLVWLSLSLLVFAIFLVIDRAFLFTRPHAPTFSLWDLATSMAMSSFDSAPSSVVAPLLLAAFHIALLYAIGFLLGLLLPGPIVAFFAGAFLWIAVSLCWLVVTDLRIPFWWTIGLFPLIFLAVAWVRLTDWLIGRINWSTRCKAAGVFGVPFVGIFAATIVFRITEIPAVVIPQTVLESGSSFGAGAQAHAKQSLFVDAMNAVSGGPSIAQGLSESDVLSDGWGVATADEKAWVNNNERARKLALEAAREEPGTFPAAAGTESSNRTAQVLSLRKIWWLARLLLYSAREMESRDRLDDALSYYVAVARLGIDADRSGQPWQPGFGSSYSVTALDRRQRWAAHPKQTTERVKKAIRESESFAPNAISLSGALLRNWRVERELLRRKISGQLPSEQNNRTVSELWWIRWFIPWELVRMDRLFDAIFAADLAESDALESELRAQGFVTMTAERVARWDHRSADPWKYWQTTLALPEIVQVIHWEPAHYVDRLATERMDLIALAIADFKREHHTLPESLQALVPSYFPRLPVDPWAGGEFIYERKGLASELPLQERKLDSGTAKLDPGTPFLASAGMLDSHLVRKTADGPSPEYVNRVARPEYPGARGLGPIFPGPIVPLK